MKPKRLLSLILTVCLLAGLMPASAFAQNEGYYLCYVMNNSGSPSPDFNSAFNNNTWAEAGARDYLVLVYGEPGNLNEANIIPANDCSVAVRDGNSISAFKGKAFGSSYDCIVVEHNNAGDAKLVINYNNEDIAFPYTVIENDRLFAVHMQQNGRDNWVPDFNSWFYGDRNVTFGMGEGARIRFAFCKHSELGESELFDVDSTQVTSSNPKVVEVSTIERGGQRFWNLQFLSMGEATLTIENGGSTYTMNAVVELPYQGFAKDKIPTASNVLPESFSYTEADRVFYYFINHNRNFFAQDTEYEVRVRNGNASWIKSELVDTGESFELNDGSKEHKYAIKLTVQPEALGDFDVDITCYPKMADGSIDVEHGRNINLCDATSRLYACWINWDEDDEYYLDYDSASAEVNLSVYSGDEWQFFYGVGRDIREKHPKPLKVTSVVSSNPDIVSVRRSDEHPDYWRVTGCGIGRSALTVTVEGGTEYTIPVRITMPGWGYSTTPVPSQSSLLGHEFDYDSENKEFYFFINEDRCFIPENAKYTVDVYDGGDSWIKSELVDTGEIFTFENGTTANRYAIKITVQDCASEDFYIDVNCDAKDRWGEENNKYGADLSLYYAVPRPYACWINRDEYYLDYDTASAEVNLSVYSGEEWQFFYGIGREIIENHPDPLNVTSVVSSDTDIVLVSPSKKYDGYWRIDGIGIGSTTLIVTVKGGEVYTIPVRITMPGWGYSTTPVPSQSSLLGHEFDYDSENKEFYFFIKEDRCFIPENAKYTVDVYDGEDSWIKSELVDTGEIFTFENGTTANRYAIKITVQDCASEDFYIDVNCDAKNRRGEENNKYGADLSLYYAVPRPYACWINWDEDDEYYLDYDSASAEVNLSVYSGDEWQFFYGVGRDIREKHPKPLKVTSVVSSNPDIVSVRRSDEHPDYWRVKGCSLGDATLTVTVEGGTEYIIPVHVALPSVAFYSKPHASIETMLDYYDFQTYYPGKVIYFIDASEDSFIGKDSYVEILVNDNPNQNYVEYELVPTDQEVELDDGTTATRYAVKISYTDEATGEFGFMINATVCSLDGTEWGSVGRGTWMETMIASSENGVVDVKAYNGMAGCVFAALYDENGKMLAIKSSSIDPDNSKLAFDFSEEWDDASLCKVFITGEDHGPLMEAACFSTKEE